MSVQVIELAKKISDLEIPTFGPKAHSVDNQKKGLEACQFGATKSRYIHEVLKTFL